MAFFEPEPEPSRGLSIPRAAIAVLIVIGFGIGMFVGWLSSSVSDPGTPAPRAQQAAATIMHDPAPLITNMPPLSEAGEPPVADLAADRAVATETPALEPPPPDPPIPQAPMPSAPPVPANPPPVARPAAPEPASALPIQPISASIAAEPPKPMPAVSTTATPGPPPRAPSKPHAVVPTAHEASAQSGGESGPWVVQLGMFRVEDHAKALIAEAAGHGLAAKITNEPDAAGEARYCVRTGHYPSREVALAAAHELAKRDGFDTYVLKPHAAGAE